MTAKTLGRRTDEGSQWLTPKGAQPMAYHGPSANPRWWSQKLERPSIKFPVYKIINNIQIRDHIIEGIGIQIPWKGHREMVRIMSQHVGLIIHEVNFIVE
jgi:hypothetical protein